MHQDHIYSLHNEKLSQYDPEHPYIPLTMFLMLPSTQDYYYVGQGKSIRRFLFQGTATETYTKFELQKYKQFQTYWQNNKQKIPATILNNPFWDYSWKMKWLTSEQYDIQNTIKAMEIYTAYLATNLTNVTTLAEKHLKQGIFYVSGRDAYMRPILVFDIDKIIKSNMAQQEILQSQKFFFQKIQNQYLLPGQVQTWVALIDVGYQSLLSLIPAVKKTVGFLSNTFRSRMGICYVVRIPGSLSFMWKIIKAFLKQDTANKINFIDDQIVGPLLKYTHPSQLQVKYGGTQPQIKQFWPLKSVKRLQQLKLLNFSHPKVVRIPISQQAYKIKYDKKRLQGHKICKILIEDSKKKQVQQLSKLKERLEEQGKQKQKSQQNNRIQNKVGLPIQYIPLVAPIIKNQDIISWQKIII